MLLPPPPDCPPSRDLLLERFTRSFEAQIALHMRMGVGKFTLIQSDKVMTYAELSLKEQVDLLHRIREKYCTRHVLLDVQVVDHPDFPGEHQVQLTVMRGLIVYMAWLCCMC